MSGSNTLGATIRLEGEKEYRDAITKINSSLKVMASEMNKVTAEFSKNDKSTAALKSYLSLFCNEKSNQKRSKGISIPLLKPLTDQRGAGPD